MSLIKHTVKAFCDQLEAHRCVPINKSVSLPKYTLVKAQHAVDHIIAAQRKILSYLLNQLGPANVLKQFGVPLELMPWMQILCDVDMEIPMLRADVLLNNQGGSSICEINVDSSIGGMEAFEFYRIEQLGQDRRLPESPLSSVARLLGRELIKHNASRICVLDFSQWLSQGFFSADWLLHVFRSELPGIDITLATELDGLDVIDKDTVIYRMFISQDIGDQFDYIRGVFARAAKVVSDFSGDLMSSKVWPVILYDESYRQLLSYEECEAIDQFIPHTQQVTLDNFEQLLKTKDRWFFKSTSDYGGKGVICGRDVTADVIRNIVGESFNKLMWIAQESVEIEPLMLELNNKNQLVGCNSVLGLYRIGNEWCEGGALVRAMEKGSVVNVAQGSQLGWGYWV